ncbi:PAX-interacting protein 1-like [Bacillus rossius redtenbacheri]|uniref:PAX-interacting protein 1-like n=1 Tax=Bacillus rossius redtenbacheri TaxID=93214 RepID=UPI002FDDE977
MRRRLPGVRTSPARLPEKVQRRRKKRPPRVYKDDGPQAHPLPVSKHTPPEVRSAHRQATSAPMFRKAMLVLATAAAVTAQAGFSGIQAFGPFAAALMGQHGGLQQPQQLQPQLQQPQQQPGELPPGLAHLQLQLSQLLQQQQQQQQQQQVSAGYYPGAAQSFTARFPSTGAPTLAPRPAPGPAPGPAAPAAPAQSLLGVAFSPANTASQLRFSGFGANYSY